MGRCHPGAWLFPSFRAGCSQRSWWLCPGPHPSTTSNWDLLSLCLCPAQPPLLHPQLPCAYFPPAFLLHQQPAETVAVAKELSPTSSTSRQLIRQGWLLGSIAGSRLRARPHGAASPILPGSSAPLRIASIPSVRQQLSEGVPVGTPDLGILSFNDVLTAFLALLVRQGKASGQPEIISINANEYL